jgi:hypothetical protein
VQWNGWTPSARLSFLGGLVWFRLNLRHDPFNSYWSMNYFSKTVVLRQDLCATDRISKTFTSGHWMHVHLVVIMWPLGVWASTFWDARNISSQLYVAMWNLDEDCFLHILLPQGFFAWFGTAISLTTGPFKKRPGKHLKDMAFWKECWFWSDEDLHFPEQFAHKRYWILYNTENKSSPIFHFK